MKILINGYAITENIKLKTNLNEDIWKLDNFIGSLKHNRRQYKRLVILLPSTTLQVFAEGSIIGIGLEFYKYIKEIGYVICLLGASIESIKCVISGTIDQLGKVAIKYVAFSLIGQLVFFPKKCVISTST
ncbi:MAG: hypothetical protein RRY11_13310 [Terrisporobacter sp.]